MKEIKKVAVVGTSELVSKISGCFAKAGVEVGGADKVAGADLVLECVPANVDPGKDSLANAARKAPADAVLATTAAWGITEIAAATGKQDKVVGLHFTFNPLEDKCLVQVVKGMASSPEIVNTCKSLLEKAGVAAIVVDDSPGLVVDRVMAATINEAAAMLSTGVASVEDIDRITKLCLNWPMGPLEFADSIGLDNVVATLDALSKREGPRFLPSRLLTEMVAVKKLGKKTKAGFYSY